MIDLLEFLRARLDDDERAARRGALVPPVPAWRASENQVFDAGNQDDNSALCVAQSEWDEVAEHIARHDPARVLREVEAKRRIIQLHSPRYAVAYRESDRLLAEAFDRDRVDTVGVSQPIYDPELLLLALPHADHPDYRDEWRP